MNTLEIILTLAWLAIGAWGVIFWWTKDYDFEGGIEWIPLLVSAMIGPFAWGVGWLVHGEHDQPKRRVIFKKRNGRDV